MPQCKYGIFCCCFVIDAAQKKGYMDLHEVAWEENVSRSYGATLAKDPGCNLPCSWTTADPSTFLIRGETYLQDNQKVLLLFHLFSWKELKFINLHWTLQSETWKVDTMWHTW